MYDYKSLSNAEKISKIAEIFFQSHEYKFVEEYRQALTTSDSKVIADFESFGNYPRQIIYNKMQYTRAAAIFGFTEKHFDGHGRLGSFTFADCETVDFDVEGHTVGCNSITTGRSPNGKWTYGMSLGASKAGESMGISVQGEPFGSRRECLKSALGRFIARHEKVNDRKTAKIIDAARTMLQEITCTAPKQVSFFTAGLLAEYIYSGAI
jgi:hypothetical protein